MEQDIKPDNCIKCGLWKTSCVVNYQGQFFAYRVMGTGPQNAKVIFIGEALGQAETINQKPFVGDAGDTLNIALKEANINREDVYITNTCKCFYSPNVLVFTSKGWKMLGKIRKDDLVLTHKGRFRRVIAPLKIKVHPDTTFFTCYLKSNGGNPYKITVTGDHKFLTNKEWTKVSDLRIGDRVRVLAQKCIQCGSLFYSDYRQTQLCSLECTKKWNGIRGARQNRVQNIRDNISKSMKELYKKGIRNGFKDTINFRRKLDGSLNVIGRNGVGEKELYELLTKNRYEVKRQKLIADRYFADFYLPKLNIVIEVWNSSYRSMIDKRIWYEQRGYKFLDYHYSIIFRYPEVILTEIRNLEKNDNHEFNFIDTLLIDKKGITPRRKSVFSLSVVEDESFIAGGLVSHNCRPPENRPPKTMEIKCCLPFLLEEIRNISPKIICTLGSVALEAILKRKGISNIRGNIYETEIEGLKVKVIPTYHPAYVLRRPEYPNLKVDFHKDIKLVKEVSDNLDYKKEKLPTYYCTTPKVEDILIYIDKIKKVGLFGYDIETEGFNFLKDRIISIALSCVVQEAIAFYLIDYTPDEQDKIFAGLKEILESKELLKIGQNLKFDNKFFKTYGIEVKLPLFDTMLAHFLIDENSSHGLKDLAYKYTDMGGYEENFENIFKELKGKMKKDLIESLKETKKNSLEVYTKLLQEGLEKIDNFSIVPKEVLLPYNASDVDCTLRIYYALKDLIEKEELTKVYYYIMIPLLIVLTETEYSGIQIDTNYLNILSKDLQDRIEDIQFQINSRPEIKKVEELLPSLIKSKKIEDIKFNINSPKHLQVLLYKVCNLQPIKQIKTGYSTDEATLKTLQEKSEIVKLIMQYRTINHDFTTYVEQLRSSLDENGKCHTDYMQHGAVSGRVISHKPNLQNIPRDSNIKKLFIPDKGCVIISADYAQIEYKVWANYSNDPQMLEDIRNGLDIHSEVCCLVWPHLYKKVGDKQYLHILTGEIKSKVSAEHRVKAKQVVFGLIYGRGIPSLVKDLGITELEAIAIVNYVLGKYPKAKLWLENQKKDVKKYKRVKDLFGRIRRLPEIDSKDNERVAEVIRQCCNAPVQGGAADITSIATIRVYNLIKKLEMLMRLILTIHDSLKYSTPVKEIDKGIECMKKGMCSSIPGVTFPLEIEIEIGPNWYDLISLEEFNKDRNKYLKEWNLLEV